ncbi:MAG TPA: MotA/TolQ/ExbB proton channel family protein [Hyphomicrobiales bacterium]|nr:MotA/TolQ/ExbB proton channel family protein [Hyphomicrobiales bacterium]
MKILLRSVILTLGVLGSSALVAQDINAVLDQARAGRQAEQQQFAQRAAQFEAADTAARQQMLNEANTQRDALAAQVNQKAETYSDNDLTITNLNGELRNKANGLGLGELFGQARQLANDAITGFQQSMIGAQYPEDDRVQFLQTLSTTTRILTVDQLERLWLEIQQEMTASGEVAKWNGSVVLPGGATKTADIIRIGPFIAMSEGNYLTYRPELNLLSELPRQPPNEFMSDAARLAAATSGYVLATADSTRGVMLNLYVERPTLEERIELGEEVGYVIIATGIAGGIAFLLQLLYLIKVRLAVARQIRRIDQPSKDNPLGRVLMVFKGDAKALEEETDVLELRLTEAVLKEIPPLERSQALLRLVVAAGPLLGLVGTVVGMIITFQSITESGSSDPKLMATGIGQAMIATVLGLGVAVPLLFGNALLTSLSRGIIQILDEQSAGLLAETLENRRKPHA